MRVRPGKVNRRPRAKRDARHIIEASRSYPELAHLHNFVVMKTFKSSTALVSLAFTFNVGLVACSGDEDNPPDPMCKEAGAGPAGTTSAFAGLTFEQPFGAMVPVMMSTVWGDRETAAHGTIGIFPPGFDPGPHTHTNAYWGVVLQGNITNPFGTEADAPVLEPGSHWFVPAGEQHTTRCVSTTEDCIFYFHGEDLFDFAPIADVTDARSAEAVTVAAAEAVFEEVSPFAEMAALWGDRSAGAHGTLGRFPAGATSPEHVHSGEYYGVVISGTVENPFNDDAGAALSSGGYWQVPADAEHITRCVSAEPCVFYFHARSAFDFDPICAE